VCEEKSGSAYFATQDGTPINEDYYNSVDAKVENLFDNLSEEIGPNSNKSLGWSKYEYIKILTVVVMAHKKW
jgi:hypothetical protein